MNKQLEFQNLPDEHLALSQNKQGALLGHLLKDDKFAAQCYEVIEGSWFAEPKMGRVWEAKRDFWRKFRRAPTREELLESEAFQLEDQASYNRMVSTASSADLLTQSYKLDALVPELKYWLHSRYFVEGVTESVRLFNRGQFEAAYELMGTKLYQMKRDTFDGLKPVDWTNFDEWQRQSQLDVDTAMTFGLGTVDRLLFPEANPPDRRDTVSLMRGDQTLVISPLNIGKTTTMLNVAIANALRRKRVLVLAHEGRQNDLMDKAYRSALGCTKSELNVLRNTPEGADLFLRTTEHLNEHLHYLHMTKAGLSVEEVGDAVRRMNDTLAAKNGGKGYDLVVDDYLAKLISSNTTLAGNWAHRNLIGYVYNYFVMLAEEMNFHHFTAQQTNRAGSKVNKGMMREGRHVEERLLVPEDSNESIEPSQTAANVITVNRDQYCQHLNFTVFNVCKSRTGPVGLAVIAKGNWKKAISHSDALGACWYRGNLPPGKQVEALFEEYAHKDGGEVPYLASLRDGNPD